MTTTGTRETTVSTPTDVPTIVTSREFEAAPTAVFRAHVDPDVYRRWYGPRGTTSEFERYDCRSGGSYRIVHRSEGHELAFHGSFHEVREPERIVQTTAMEGAGGGVGLETLEFTDLGAGRTRLVSTLLVGSFAERDMIVSTGMEHGVRESYERLDELLAS